MGQHFTCALSFFLMQLLTACGSEQPARNRTTRTPFSVERQHDYGSAWVYTVGEVENPVKNDCAKAFEFIKAETDCLGKACSRAITLIHDYEYACRKLATSDERAKIATLSATFAERNTQPMTPCLEKVETWLERGCGENGACENQVQRWATQCSDSTRSKLIIHLLERLVENSLQEPRRIKLDSRSCNDFAKTVDEFAGCNKPFDCEDALPKIDEYLLRCAQGKLHAVPLRTALSIVKIRLGAEKTIDPLALTDDATDIPVMPGALPLVDQSGVVLKVCGEPTADLKSYLEQRSACKDGSVTLLRASKTPEGQKLGLLQVPHASDEQYQSAYPKLWVKGEAEVRADNALAAFSEAMGALPERAVEDFAGALSKVNIAYSNLPPSLRQSPKLRAVLLPHDAALSPLFAIIASSKVSVAGTRLPDDTLSAFLRRSETLVFADVAKTGNIELGARVDLSELLTKEALPGAFAAYARGLEKLRKLAVKRKLDLTIDLTAARAQMTEESRACTSARTQYGNQQKQFEQCLLADDGCPQEHLDQLSLALVSAKTAWREARVREIIAKISAAQPATPSAVCSSL
jgi:hypothetical protein